MKCRFCRSKKLVKAGKASVYAKPRQRYFCKNCRRYTVNPIRENKG